MAIAISNLAVGAMDKELAFFLFGNGPAPFNSLALRVNDVARPRGSLPENDPFVAPRDDVDILTITHRCSLETPVSP